MQATTHQFDALPIDRGTGQRARSFAPRTSTWIRLAAIYLLVSVFLGIAMGASGNFGLRSVHSHIGLLGWTTLAFAGLIYRAFPEAGASRLARAHFWLYNLALPLMMGSLAAMLLGYAAATPLLAGSQIVLAAGLLAFIANVLLNLRSPDAAQSADVTGCGSGAQNAEPVR